MYRVFIISVNFTLYIKIGYSLTNCQHITARKTDVMNGTVQTKKATFCLMKNN